MDNRIEDRRRSSYCNVEEHDIYEVEIRELHNKINSSIMEVKKDIETMFHPYLKKIDDIYRKLFLGNGQNSIQTQVSLNTQKIDILMETQKSIAQTLSRLTDKLEKIEKEEGLNTDFREGMKKILLKTVTYSIAITGTLILAFLEVSKYLGR